MSTSITRRILWPIGAATVVTVGYLSLWPVPIAPKAWAAPAPPRDTGTFAVNSRLAGLHYLDLGAEHGPEQIAVGPDGKLYAAMTSGRVLRMDPDGTHREVFANTGGRILGFAFDANGRMFAADAMRGLYAITPDGRATLVTNRVRADDPVRYANAVAVAPDGTIYLTDSSTRFAPSAWGGTYEASFLDILEQAASGRVLAVDPTTGATRIVARGLSFANGIALSADGRALFVAETGRYRIWRIDREARDLDVQRGSPMAHVLIDNLPGYPDNVTRGEGGRLWVGLFRPRTPAADRLAQHPSLRKVLLRVPRTWLPTSAPSAHVLAIDEQGNVLEDLQDPSGAYPGTTGATEIAGRLYVHSLFASSIGWVAR